MVEHDDLVGVAHGRQPVRNRDRRPALGQSVERLLHEPLRLGIERACRLVEDEYRRIAQNRPRDRDPLLLSPREAVTALTDDGLIAFGQRCNHMVDARRLGGPLDLLVGCIRLGEPQVLAHRLVEEVGLLRDDTDQVGERLKAQIADVHTADRDPSSAGLVEPRGQIAERRLAGAGLPDQCGRRARRHGEGDVLERPVLAVAKPNLVEDDVARLPDSKGVRLLLDVDRLVEVFEDPVEQCQRGLQVEADAE